MKTSTKTKAKRILQLFAALLLLLFGLLTLFLSTSVIFDLFGIRAHEGNYVPLVVYANFVASILYLVASMGFFTSQKWTPIPLIVSTLILVAAFVGLLVHVKAGGAFETKTIGAMVFRISITAVMTFTAFVTRPSNIQ